jgi:hypothetical protein
MPLKEVKYSQEIRDYLAQRQRNYRAAKKVRDATAKQEKQVEA